MERAISNVTLKDTNTVQLIENRTKNGIYNTNNIQKNAIEQEL